MSLSPSVACYVPFLGVDFAESLTLCYLERVLCHIMYRLFNCLLLKNHIDWEKRANISAIDYYVMVSVRMGFPLPLGA